MIVMDKIHEHGTNLGCFMVTMKTSLIYANDTRYVYGWIDTPSLGIINNIFINPMLRKK